MADFAKRLRGDECLLGTFVKTAAAPVVEILGAAGLDFLVLDQEHAPLGRESIDRLLLAARAAGIPALVRVAQPAEISHALDGGAAGIVAPHVTSAADAQDIVARSRYRERRGYSNGTRAGGYGARGLADHGADPLVVVMIEDASSDAAAIVAVPGVDATLIGCADLAVSLGEPSADAPRVREIVARIARTGRCLAPVASLADAGWLRELGLRSFVVGSDQGLLRAGALAMRRAFEVAS